MLGAGCWVVELGGGRGIRHLPYLFSIKHGVAFIDQEIRYTRLYMCASRVAPASLISRLLSPLIG